jgi:phytoene synthase
MTVSAAAKSAASAETRASGSSFYSAMRLLPKKERSAMFAIYGFCRQVDDIADEIGPTPVEQKAQLDVWRRAVDSLYTPGPSPRVKDLAGPVWHYGLIKDDFVAVMDGMEMDIDGPIRRPPFEILDLYCDRVASAVGRLSVRVFGMDMGPGRDLAYHLGRALQLTNILRDLDEDAGMGRLYLPDEALTAAGIEGDDPKTVLDHPALATACAWTAAKAHEHYLQANAVLARKPKGRLRAPRLMGAVYRTTLKRMERRGWNAPRERVSLGKGTLAWILLTRGLGR